MELLLLLVLVSVSPWALSLTTQARLSALGVTVLCSGVVVGPLFFSYQLGTQLSIDRVMLLWVLGVCSVRCWNRKCQIPKLQRADVVLLLLAAWLLIRSLVATAPPQEIPPFSRWLTFIAIPIAMFAIARITPLETKDLRILISALIGLGVYLGVTAIFEVCYLHSLVFPRYVVDPTNWEFLGRARGPLLNPTGNGIVLTIAFAAALLRVIHGNRLEQFRYGFITFIIGIGIVATLTRSVWIGAVVVVFVVGWIYALRFVPAVIMGGCAVLVLLGTIFSADSVLELKRDKHLSAADAAKSVALRPVLALVAWEMFKDSPVTGHGYGGYFDSSQPYLASRSQDAAFDSVRPYMQHNIVLSFLVDGGLIAVVLFLLLLAFVGRCAWALATERSESPERRTLGLVMLGCLSGYLFNGMFHDVSVIPMASNFLLFLSGVTLTAAAQHHALPTRSPATRPSINPNGFFVPAEVN